MPARQGPNAGPERSPRPPGSKGSLKRRPLTAADFEAVVDLDSLVSGRSRRGYFEKRLQAALRHPDIHLQFAVDDADGFVGFVLARIVEGEFGESDAAVVLEAIGVVPRAKGQGAGRLLVEGLEAAMRRKRIPELRTQVEWTNHEFLRFLDALGFKLAPEQIVECPVDLAASL